MTTLIYSPFFIAWVKRPATIWSQPNQSSRLQLQHAVNGVYNASQMFSYTATNSVTLDTVEIPAWPNKASMCVIAIFKMAPTGTCRSGAEVEVLEQNTIMLMLCVQRQEMGMCFTHSHLAQPLSERFYLQMTCGNPRILAQCMFQCFQLYQQMWIKPEVEILLSKILLCDYAPESAKI